MFLVSELGGAALYSEQRAAPSYHRNLVNGPYQTSPTPNLHAGSSCLKQDKAAKCCGEKLIYIHQLT
jgi:hypothetical protein